jgi:hypothetical protein
VADELADGPDEAALAVAARHALHDEELIAALAGADLEPEEAARAQALVERCQACAALHADLTAVMAAVRASGTAADVAAARPAPRDFRLTPEMVGISRPASPVARPAYALAAALGGFSRPLGVTFAALGLVGVLVGSVNLGTGGAAPMAAEAQRTGVAAGGDPGVLSGGPASAAPTGPAATDGTKFDTSSGPGSTRDAAGASTILIVGSGLLVLAGVVLIAAGRLDRAPAPR